MKSKPALKKKKKKVFSEAERQRSQKQNAHRKEIRAIFIGSGFSRVADISDKEFTFEGTTSDVDDVFVYQNVIILTEYTISQESDVSTHLKKKKILYDKVLSNAKGAVEFFTASFPAFAASLSDIYSAQHYQIRIAYCSLNTIKNSLKLEVPGPYYFDYNVVRYFKSLTDTIKYSARYEVFAFLGIKVGQLGPLVLKPTQIAITPYHGSVLPEAHSSFDAGFKIVSFYMDAAGLLERAYVLRRDGWKDDTALYQRMISKAKIESIRKYLLEKKRVFVNNIIVTLPSSTKLIDKNGDTIDPKTIENTSPTTIQLPALFNSIGLIDGQHRAFSYYESSGSSEAAIQTLRTRQNLLVTGIIYPASLSEHDRMRFEANLFLEINANQTGAKTDLKQSIEVILRPFASESIARRVIVRINDSNGPLANEFQKFFYEKTR